jgi:hypothetical protein
MAAATSRASLSLRAVPFGGWRRPSFVDQALEALAVLGPVDGVRRGADDGHAGRLEITGELERRLPAVLDDDPSGRSTVDDLSTSSRVSGSK